MYETVATELDDGLLRITLNRPESLNTIVPPMPQEFEDAIIRAPSARATTSATASTTGTSS